MYDVLLYILYVLRQSSRELGRVKRGRGGGACRKIFWDHFSKSLVTIQVFTSATWAPIGLKNGGNWQLRKLVLTSFSSLRELRASFPFISVAERQGLKLGMLEEKDTNCSRRLWRKITCGDVKSVPKIFGRSQQRWDTIVMTFLCTFFSVT